MEILIGWSVIAIISIVHILALGFAFKKYFNNLPNLVNAILRGLVVGACVNYFFFLLWTFFTREHTIFFVISALPFSIAIGVVTTSIFWFTLTKIELSTNSIGRLASIIVIGIIMGIATGMVASGIFGASGENANSRVVLLCSYFCSMNLTAGIMLTEKKFYDPPVISQENNL